VRSGAKRTVGGAIALAAVGLLAFPAAALAAPGDVPGTATLTGGSFTMVTPSALTFAGVLDGTNKVLDTTQALDVLDQTGSGAGWNITLTSTQFTTADTIPLTLSTAAATDGPVAPTGVCDVVESCTLGTNTVAYDPLVVPAAAVTAPTAVKIQTAAVDTGLAGQTWTHNMRLAIPANTKAGVYSSTWTYSLISAP
jgi:hypothetical protein